MGLDESLTYLDNAFGRDMCIMEIEMKRAEMRAIKNLLQKNQEVHRITKRWRDEAVHTFCNIHGITLESYTPFSYTMNIPNAPPVNDMIAEYVTAINQYRLQVRTDLHNRCTGLEQDVMWILGELDHIEMNLLRNSIE